MIAGDSGSPEKAGWLHFAAALPFFAAEVWLPGEAACRVRCVTDGKAEFLCCASALYIKIK